MSTRVSSSEILRYLNELGWSDLIDSRWKREVISDIEDKFPNVSDEVLNEVLDLILC